MKKRLPFLIIPIIAVIVVFGGKRLFKLEKQKEAREKPAKAYSVYVKTITPKNEKVQLTLPFLAVTKNNDDVKISSKVPARIDFIVKNGTAVKKGDLIVKLDDSDLKSKLKSLEYNIHSLNSQMKSKEIALQTLIETHKRTEKLLKIKGASKEQYDKEFSQIELSKAAIKTLKYKIKEIEENIKSVKNMLSYTSIIAPVSGIATKMANIGDVAMPGKPLISISSNSNSYLLVRLPEKVKATSLIYKGKKIPLMPLNTTFNGLLEYLANIDESLPANQRVEVDVVVYDSNGFFLPFDTILNRDGGDYVLSIKNGKAESKKVKIIAEGEQGVVVDNISVEKIAVAKPDVLLKLLSGISVKGL